jgi:hypothetical protein
MGTVGTMTPNNLEDELRTLRLAHLTEAELAGYCDQGLDLMRRARVEAHVKDCFRCEQELALLLEESAALNNRQITAEDVALVERLMEQKGPATTVANPAEIANEIPLRERLAEYLRQMVAGWQMDFGHGTLRGALDQGEEVWRWQSEDGRLQVRAMIEKNADMTIRFSSSEMELGGTHLRFGLGELNQETTLQKVSESEVAAQVAVPWQYRQGNIANISVQII